MKEFCTYLALSLTVVIGSFILLALMFKPAQAEPEIVQDFVQCTYKPSQSDEVIVYCGTLKGGKGSVSIRICGVNYVVDVKCA